MRLWPVSRKDYPKQFFKLLDEDRSLFQNTVLRAMSISGAHPSDVLTVTLGRFKGEVRRQLFELNPDLTRHVLGEPEPRDTAAAFLFSAYYVVRHWGRDSLMLMLPSDHHIQNPDALERALKKGVQAAGNGFLVTFGITPNRAQTGYGYIQKSKKSCGKGVWEVDNFVEKPSLETAQKLYESGSYLWSSGVHLFKAGAVLDAFQDHAEKTVCLMKRALAHSPDGTMPSLDIYNTIMRRPYEKAVLEKAGNVAVVPCDIGWSDVGSWESLWEVSPKDQRGNVVEGRVLHTEMDNSIVHAAGDRLVKCVGVKNLVVVDTPDVVMIADKTQMHLMKTAIGVLHDSSGPEVNRSVIQTRPWGTIRILSETKGFRVRELVIHPGGRRSFQRHHYRDEQWFIASGSATISVGGETQVYKERDSITIPARTVHGVLNTTKADVRIFEIHYGDRLGEEDIIRFDDPYGQKQAVVA